VDRYLSKKATRLRNLSSVAEASPRGWPFLRAQRVWFRKSKYVWDPAPLCTENVHTAARKRPLDTPAPRAVFVALTSVSHVLAHESDRLSGKSLPLGTQNADTAC
jgi:hypothetical protein